VEQVGGLAAGAAAAALVRGGLARGVPAPEGVGSEGVAPAALAVASAQDVARPAAAVPSDVAALRQSKAPEVRESKAPAAALATPEKHFAKARGKPAAFALVEVETDSGAGSERGRASSRYRAATCRRAQLASQAWNRCRA